MDKAQHVIGNTIQALNEVLQVCEVLYSLDLF
jgi:hypothetical protein